MGKRDLQKEKQMELAAIWGSEVEGDARYPRRRGGKKVVVMPSPDTEAPMDVEDAPSDIESDASGEVKREDFAEEGKKTAKAAKKARSLEYRLHCFVEPGTEKNAVRTVFEAYEPKVDIRTSQKGSLLNKTQFAVLTFRNKAMALHAVKTLEGTNQRDLLGVSSLKMNLMLNRHQSKVARKKINRQMKQEKKKSMMDEAEEDMNFVRQFIQRHTSKK